MIGLIAGPQGCGKGTQAKFIERDYGFKPISMGDLLREERDKDTDLAKQLKEIMARGDLVPNEITFQLIKNSLDVYDKVLLDGFPRNMEQAEWVFNNIKPNFMIVIDISEDETVKRLEKRRICTATKKIFIADKIADKDIEDCKAAGGEIIQRDDDKPEAIKHRLNIYRDQTEPVEKFFVKNGVPTFKIDGAQSIEDVYESLKEKISSIL
ncbi:nucleoside monophosphate kinase [Candidatus Woesearchaeota archaeon]|nr:nucleoside monophosphate kinase [Candidatus Woesearchaeota archaeon]MCF7901090.1 nucleoside monophosphate kinase [Candidatus Woesearchaeota archaeon]MCF8013423.1 nucleoside monophosphate kinase [Candidatus Woesearchaeota archaeon]